MIERARKRIGEVTPITGGFNSEAQLDTIRHFAEGIGDDNPLWLDPEYAAKTQHGTLLAPPSYLLSCNQGPMWRGRTSGGFRGFTGVHRFWSSDAWEWFLPIKRGDSIRGESQLSEFIEHKSAMAGRTIEDIAIQKFYNQGDELIGTHRLHFINTERSTAAERGKHKEFKEHVWTQEELEKLWADIEKEERRGAEPRFWEDVTVGEEIPWVVKGPLSQCEIVAFHAGWGGLFLMASEIAQRFVQKHPKANVPDRTTMVPDFPMRAHWDRAFAREVGAPSAYDFGGQRLAWLCSALTNWCGDDGMVRGIDVKFVRFNVQGDATWCSARITGKEIVDGEPLVFFDCWGKNQDGHVTVTGTAKVRLPSKGRV
ncbi:MAG: MaoC family dehydratase N-terminal domain-containing protein [Acidimicrobiia bacterium]